MGELRTCTLGPRAVDSLTLRMLSFSDRDILKADCVPSVEGVAKRVCGDERAAYTASGRGGH